jgi:3-oxoacyl-[acyl-carrier protein] reductase
MELGLSRKTALVTGSTKGIGKAIAVELAKEGVDVIVNGRQAAVVDQVAAELKERFPQTNPQSAPFDLADPNAREKRYLRNVLK